MNKCLIYVFKKKINLVLLEILNFIILMTSYDDNLSADSNCLFHQEFYKQIHIFDIFKQIKIAFINEIYWKSARMHITCSRDLLNQKNLSTSLNNYYE